MVVKTDRACLMTITLGLGICVVAAVILFLYIGALVCSLLLLCVSVPLIAFNHMQFGKTIIFEETGCTVRYRKKVKFFGWEDLAVKRVEPPYIGRYGYSKGGAFFSTVPTKKDPVADPGAYALFHPKTCFWVYFKSDRFGSLKNSFGIYEVDKEEFLHQLKVWNVDLEVKH